MYIFQISSMKTMHEYVLNDHTQSNIHKFEPEKIKWLCKNLLDLAIFSNEIVYIIIVVIMKNVKSLSYVFEIDQ